MMNAQVFQIIVVILGCVMAGIGYLISRNITKFDETQKATNIKVDALTERIHQVELDDKDRPILASVEDVAKRVAISEINEYHIKYHAGNPTLPPCPAP